VLLLKQQVAVDVSLPALPVAFADSHSMLAAVAPYPPLPVVSSLATQRAVAVVSRNKSDDPVPSCLQLLAVADLATMLVPVGGSRSRHDVVGTFLLLFAFVSRPFLLVPGHVCHRWLDVAAPA
jgi:hypothetical protein